MERCVFFQRWPSCWTSKSDFRWRTCVVTRMNRNQGVETLTFVSWRTNNTTTGNSSFADWIIIIIIIIIRFVKRQNVKRLACHVHVPSRTNRIIAHNQCFFVEMNNSTLLHQWPYQILNGTPWRTHFNFQWKNITAYLYVIRRFMRVLPFYYAYS